MIVNGQPVEVPLIVRMHLGRAAIQTIAREHGVDLLHIKGDAVDATLRPTSSGGTDIDVLIRPNHVRTMDLRLRAHGWRVYTTFDKGSPFGHAQTYHHDVWGFLDLHRFFPGIRVDASVAFESLWENRTTIEFGGSPCSVPALPAQAAILILNAARMRVGRRRDLLAAWDNATEQDRARVLHEIESLDAHLAFDAAFGDLERHRGEREYRLWRAVSLGGGRLDEWWGRIQAADTTRARLQVILTAPQVNLEHLELELGRRPTKREILRQFLHRLRMGARELTSRDGRQR